MHAKRKIMPYIVDLSKLQADSLSLDYKLDDAFFDAVGGSLVQRGELVAVVVVKKKAGDTFSVQLDIHGNVAVPCDRCLDDVVIPIDVTERLAAKMGSECDDSDDCIVVPFNKPLLDIGTLLYEYIAVAVPIQNVHEEGHCNEDMVSKLKDYLVEDIDEPSKE